MNPEGISLIGFSAGSPGGSSFRAHDPAKNVALEPAFLSASHADVERATFLSSQAATVLAAKDGKERGRLLRAVAAKIEANAAPLVTRAMQETGLPEARLQGEVARTVNQLRLLAGVAEAGEWCDARIETALPDRKPLPRPDHRSMLRAVGPVVVFGSSNFPFAYSVAGGDTASALAAGCPVIVKAHPAHPGTSELVGRLVIAAVKECEWPEGTFSLLFDAGFEVGQALVRHPAVRAVGFTGSRHGGRALMDIAAARPEPVPVYAEMGSINPVFLLPGALAERGDLIAEGLAASATLSVGQFCTSPGVVVLEHSASAEEFVRKLAVRLGATPEAAMLHAGIKSNFDKAVKERAKVTGVRTVVGAGLPRDESGHSAVAEAMADKKAPPTGKCSAAPVWFETDAETFCGTAALKEEIFGPSAIIVWCRNRSEMLLVAKSLEGGLTASLHAAASETAEQVALVEVLADKVGRVIFNGFPTGLEVSTAIVHGGPYPATSDGRSTAVGTRAIGRWARLVCYQNFADELLPPELKNANPLGLRRLVNGEWTNQGL
jgi:NADP-dependent aldehyde dehydrogenase